MTEPVRLSYFSDVLCVWAYVSQIRLDELERAFGDRLVISHHFLPVFGCTDHRIGEGWRERGGFEGFGEHVREVCAGFPHVEISPQVWRRNVPKSSATAHHFLASVQLLEEKGILSREGVEDYAGRSVFEESIERVRLAFFRDARNIAELNELLRVSDELELPRKTILEQMSNGEALASLFRDVELRDEYKLEGSPSYYLNQGRQKLYGNVGYRIIEANVAEMLERPGDSASWC
ncbi:MAG: disulfide bond formation protein DsbA [Deltaproteobacteria bacterium]|nr:disulfide bond formation protein DsbA [Deltaproteobacteria bacterium]